MLFVDFGGRNSSVPRESLRNNWLNLKILLIFILISSFIQFTHISSAIADATAWTSRSAAADNQWFSVTYGNGLFVASGNNGGIMTSPDGITWTYREQNSPTSWQTVCFGNGLFVAMGDRGGIKLLRVQMELRGRLEQLRLA